MSGSHNITSTSQIDIWSNDPLLLETKHFKYKSKKYKNICLEFFFFMFRHVQFACTMLKKKKKRSVKRQYDRYDYIHENRLKWLTVTDAVKHHLDTNLTNKPTTRDAVPFKIWQRIWKTIHSIWNEIKEVFVKRATNLLSLSPMNLHEFIATTRLKTRS